MSWMECIHHCVPIVAFNVAFQKPPTNIGCYRKGCNPIVLHISIIFSEATESPTQEHHRVPLTHSQFRPMTAPGHHSQPQTSILRLISDKHSPTTPHSSSNSVSVSVAKYPVIKVVISSRLCHLVFQWTL